MSSTYRTFVAKETEELWSRLERWQNCIETKTTSETYFKICEQLGKEPLPEEIPPEMDDFPEDVQRAIVCFGRLGDRVVADIGYMGKDYSALEFHAGVLGVDNRELFLETLLRLDERVKAKSNEEMARQRKKLKGK